MSRYSYKIEVTDAEIKILPSEGKTSIHVPKEESENFIQAFIADFTEATREENKFSLYRYPEGVIDCWREGQHK